MLRKLSLAVLIPACMLALYLVLVTAEYFYESELVRNELADRQVSQIKQQLLRMQAVVQSAQALQDIERIEQEVSLATLDMNVMVYILLDANSRIRFANHTVWRDSNAIEVIDGYDVVMHHAVVQSGQASILVNPERLSIQAYYPVEAQYPGATELVYLESDLAPLVARASTELQQRFMRVWGLGALLLIGFTFVLYYLLIRPFKMLSQSAKHVGTPEFTTQVPWSASEVLSLQTSLQQVHERLARAVKQLNDSEQRWLFAVEGSRNGIWDWDIRTCEVFLSDRWKEMIGYQPDELEGAFQTWESRLHPDDRQSVLDCLQEYVSGKTKEFESVHRLLHRDGHYVWVFDRGMLVDWDHLGRPTRMIGIHVDVSESERNHAAIAELVKQSETGDRMLPEAFMQQLSQYISQRPSAGHWGALLLLNVETHTVSDTLTPHELDRLLSQLNARLSSYFAENILVSHIELGRFAILTKELAADATMAGRRALALATELRHMTTRPFHQGEQSVSFNADVGICLLDSVETLAPEIALRRAELALQHAHSLEQAGCAFYHPDLEHIQDPELSLCQQLKRAITDNQLSLMFQPVVDMQGKIVAAEVLSRWHLANGDIIPVAKFIGLAERHGLIASLDLNVATRVCQLIKQFKQQGISLPRLTLNISALSFCQADFVEQLVALTRRYELDDNQLGIELTESALLTSASFIQPRISLLTEAGIAITLDNFGAGQGALSCLRHYPLNEVKLDLHCATNFTTDTSWSQALIQSVHPFNLPIVAKGVESPQQQQLFSRLGCTHFQGYNIARALSVNDFKQLVCPRPLLRSV
ncbi:EAL domain-containing protein [Shewanella decolorationis]|uniref:EAL domain-containing protein n=1 Tax=Shewanella decolorationis TaxID=256839 RepID=A0A5B8R585_9GAMM|nr:EAL domain-containing protein [Shewanella decolorationis]QDZ92861.1 EAL domain-containing protein [Shewanella decolorationis]